MRYVSSLLLHDYPGLVLALLDDVRSHLQAHLPQQLAFMSNGLPKRPSHGFPWLLLGLLVMF